MSQSYFCKNEPEFLKAQTHFWGELASNPEMFYPHFHIDVER